MALTYDHLSATDQVDAINRRIGELERDHLNVSLDVETEGPEGSRGQAERLAELEESITKLRERRDSL